MVSDRKLELFDILEMPGNILNDRKYIKKITKTRTFTQHKLLTLF